MSKTFQPQITISKKRFVDDPVHIICTEIEGSIQLCRTSK